MFQFNKKTVNFDVIIGETSVIRGDIESEGSIRIDGHLDGSVTSRGGEVIVSENAVVNGNIYAQLADLFGKCTGNIIVQTHVTLHSSASLRGDVRAESINTEKGAEFTGHCTIITKSPASERQNERGANPRPNRSESPKAETKLERPDTSTRSLEPVADAAKTERDNRRESKVEPFRRTPLRSKQDQSEKSSMAE